MRITQLIKNANLPHDPFWGRLMILKMNLFHSQLSRWGFRSLGAVKGARALDVGCGGGRNVARLRRRLHGGFSAGVDLSPLSVAEARRWNAPALLRGKSIILEAGADALPFADDYFDVVTAFETIYYWPNLDRCFQEVYRVLRPGGAFMICNEDHRTSDNPEEHAAIQALIPIAFYSNDELISRLKQAGFRYVTSTVHANGRWVSVVAYA